MTDSSSQADALSPERVTALLQRAMRARQNGDVQAARALLRALAAQRPDLPQVWLALATAAETRAEQRQALERVIALEPQNPLAQRGLARMNVVTPIPPPAVAEEAEPEPAPPVAPVPVVGAAPALTPTTLTPEERARSIRWPLYVVVGVAALLVLLAAWWLRGSANAPDSLATPTPALPGATLDVPTIGLALEATSPAGATAAPDASPALAAPTSAPPPSAAPATAAPPSVTPTIPALAVGQVVQSGTWHVALLRPNDAIVLDGSIGTLQPQGRFVLALLAVGNDGAAAARVPADLVAVVDQNGTRYPALPAVSAAYLATYGRGQRGDLSLEDDLPADRSNKSVPFLFDVPPTARGLMVMIQGAPLGWPISQPGG